MTIQSYFDEGMGVVWVQPDGPNTAMHALLCVDLDGVTEPQGDVSLQLCRQADRTWATVLQSQGTPSQVTFDIVATKAIQRSWLQRQLERRCPMPVYVQHSTCGRHDVFLNYDAGELMESATITSKAKGNMAKGRAGEGETPAPTTETFSFAAHTPAYEYYPLTITVQECDVEDEPLRDIVSCSTPQCQGACGALVDPCDSMQIVADATGIADGYATANGGALWTAWASQPFAATEDIASVVCFDIDRTTKRILVARGTADGGPMDVAYSDNGGATAWTTVAVGALTDEYAAHGGALWALDYRHIWLVTGIDFANVYFSADGGVTWEDQGAPAPVASQQLMCVHFVDVNYGMAVGGNAAASGLYLETSDGGAHWSTMAAEPSATLGTGVRVLDAYRAWVTLANGGLWYTNDWAATWEQRALPVTPNALGDIDNINDHFISVVGEYVVGAAHHPIMYRTVNGGMDWEHYLHGTAFSETVEYYGLNSVIMCGPNVVYAVGEELVGGVSAVLLYQPAGW